MYGREGYELVSDGFQSDNSAFAGRHDGIGYEEEPEISTTGVIFNEGFAYRDTFILPDPVIGQDRLPYKGIVR